MHTQNAKLLAPTQDTVEKSCNCKDKNKCPLEGKCLSKSVIYKVTVKQDNEKVNTYIGLTCNTFKNDFIHTTIHFKILMLTKLL